MERNNQEKNNAKIKLNAEGEPMIYNSKKYLGKKIVILVLFLLILAIAGFIYFSFFGNKDENQLFLEQNAEILKDKEAAETEVDKNLDSDSDKLPDYMEKVIGTNPNNPDTDGDDYDDFDEIKNGYSPLTSEKYSIEEWDNVKGKIKGEDEGLFGEMFGAIANKSNCEYKKGEYEIRAYDPQGRITGLVNGEIKQEIPDSYYSQGDVVVFDPGDMGTAIKNIQYEIFSIKEGNYQFLRSANIGGEKINFEAINIPVSSGQAHRYKFNWDILAQGKEGAMLLIDADGDGNFEKTISADNKLTCEEFNSQMGIK